MRSLILFIGLGIAGCHTRPVPCDAHLTRINHPVAAVNASSAAPRSSAPNLKGSP